MTVSIRCGGIMSLRLLVVICTLFVQPSFAMSDADAVFDFNKNVNTKYLWSRIPFFQGADFVTFKEMYSKSRRNLRREYIQEAVELMYAGAYGIEALEMVLAFDQQVTWLREYSKVRMDKSIEAIFRAELNNLTVLHRPSQNSLQFRHVNQAHDIIYRASNSVQPGFLLPEHQKYIHFVAFGTYTTTSKGLLLTFHLVNVHTGVEFNFSAEGIPTKASKILAKKVFDLFYKTHLPATLKLESGRRIHILWKDVIESTNSAPFKHTWEDAHYHCADLGGRLANKRELNSISRAGNYRGGLEINARLKADYYWAIPNKRIFSSFNRDVKNVHFTNGHRFLNYICVK